MKGSINWEKNRKGFRPMERAKLDMHEKSAQCKVQRSLFFQLLLWCFVHNSFDTQRDTLHGAVNFHKVNSTSNSKFTE